MTTFCRYRRFKKIGFYDNSLPGGYGDLTPGCHVLFEEHTADDSAGASVMARVLGIATHNGDGAKIKQSRRDPMLAVLVASDDLHFGYIRFVAKSRVRKVFTPNAFARWFLFGVAPSPELAQAVSDYGSCNGDVGKYLTAPEGELRADWHEVAMGRSKRSIGQTIVRSESSESDKA